MIILNNLLKNLHLVRVLPQTLQKMKRSATSCVLYPVDNSINSVTLPHDQVVYVGRSRETLITDTFVSKKQLKLKANYEEKTVECVCEGINVSGCNGFALRKMCVYTFRHGDNLELSIGKYVYTITFDTSKEEQPAKRLKLDEEKIDLPQNFNGNWDFIDNSLLIYSPSCDIKAAKVASFDLDGTLIKTKSGQKFPKDKNDWVLAYGNIPSKIKDLYSQGYRIVIFSNQLKLGQERSRIEGFKEKIESIVKKIGVPMQIYLATQRDIYRKPAPGMWNSFLENVQDVDLSESFYVGDAAGREKNWAPHKSKDHSVSDRLFSLNVGLKFYTPEEHFLTAKSVSFTMPEFDPRTVAPFVQEIPLDDRQEGIVMVGSQGSGKSHFCRSHIVQHGYVYVNRDSLGSKQKCLSLVEECLRTRKSFVVDNTNPDLESRKPFVDLCKKYNVPIKCFQMTTSQKHCKHNNKFRCLVDKKHVPVTDIMINSYWKKFQEPTVAEGFTDIYKLKFCPIFKDKEEEKLYKMFLLES